MRIATTLMSAACAAALGATAFPVAADVPYTGHGKHVMVNPGELTWRDAPAVGPGVQIAVIEGPLDQKTPFTFRLRIPAGTKLMPHVHPAYERVTVLSGTLHFAHGETFEPHKLVALPAGAVAIMPPGAPMFGVAKEETVIQLHGMGPWGLKYLNPAHDPRKQKP
ncbi:MAG TPA: cupin domain-containing protein [Burkholderiales bacterium]|nr:cupin domain-containing protein [Burkholderiales bacterium]